MHQYVCPSDWAVDGIRPTQACTCCLWLMPLSQGQWTRPCGLTTTTKYSSPEWTKYSSFHLQPQFEFSKNWFSSFLSQLLSWNSSDSPGKIQAHMLLTIISVNRNLFNLEVLFSSLVCFQSSLISTECFYQYNFTFNIRMYFKQELSQVIVPIQQWPNSVIRILEPEEKLLCVSGGDLQAMNVRKG